MGCTSEAAAACCMIPSVMFLLCVITNDSNNLSGLRRTATSCLWALVSAEASSHGRAHRENQSSHYSYNEIIMNGAQRPHHKNIYCIIYSASPLVQGERTHINLQPCCSPPHSGSCLPLKAEAHSCLHSSFHSVPSSFLFSLVVLLRVGASAGSLRRLLQQEQHALKDGLQTRRLSHFASWTLTLSTLLEQ